MAPPTYRKQFAQYIFTADAVNTVTGFSFV